MPDPREYPEDGKALDDAFSQATSSGLNHFTHKIGLMMVDQGKYDWTRFNAAHEGDGIIARIARDLGKT